jgi:hypothetical protein
MLNDAKKDADINHSYSTSWNLSQIPLYNPIDFFMQAKGRIQETYSQQNRDRDGQYRFDILYFDFYEQVHSEVMNIIRSSRECGGI